MGMKYFAYVASVLLSAECLFAGDSCNSVVQGGTCILLQECRSLMSEVRAAGTPLPGHLARKLQALTCGFQKAEPLVCCSASQDNDYSTETSGWNSDNIFTNDHQLGVVTEDNQNWGRPNINEITTQSSWAHIPHRDRETRKPWGSDDGHSEGNTPSSGGSWNYEADKKHGNTDQNKDSGRLPDVRRHKNIHLVNDNHCGIVESDRIIGGNRTRLFEMPWMILISYNSGRGVKLSCGGTLISPRYVLTAAHCVSYLGSLRLASVVLGEYDVRRDPDCERIEGEETCAPSVMNVEVERTIPHAGYSPQKLVDDIALIRLSRDADFSLDSVKPICLPTTPQLQSETLVGQQGVVAGWGSTEDGLQSPVLLSVSLPFVSNPECQEAYHGTPKILDSQLCAGGVRDQDSCGGDSGGPIMVPGRVGFSGTRYVQRGIVSFGSKRCGIGGFPGVYTNVAHYMDWILDNMED